MRRPVESAASNGEKWVFSEGDQWTEAGAGTLMELRCYLERCSCFCSRAHVVSPKLAGVGSGKALDVLILCIGS